MKRTFIFAASACLLTAAGLQAGLSGTITGTVYEQSGGYNSVVVPPPPTIGTLEGSFTTTTIGFGVTAAGSTLLQYLNSNTSSILTDTISAGTLAEQMSDPSATGIDGSGNQFSGGYSFEIVYTGSLTLNPGDTINIKHDDGIVLVLPGPSTPSSTNKPAPTSVTTDSYTNTTGSTITGAFTLYYEGTHGNPSITQVSFTPAAVPEPTSMILLGTTFLGLGTLVRKKFRKV